MKIIAEFPLNGGESVWVEIDQDEESAGLQPATRGEEGVVQKAQRTFNDALASIRPAAKAIVETLRELSPDELEISLGVKFSADARAIIASTGTEANIGVKLVWKKRPQ